MSRELTQDITDDAALGGRLRLLQPRRGHRFGHDAILLAAAAPAKPGDLVVDLGAGVGTAALAVAARVAGVRIAMVEVDPTLAGLAKRNADRNGFAEITTVAAIDANASPAQFANNGITPGTANCVIMNPPFHDAARTNASPDPARRMAHVGSGALLSVWIEAAGNLLSEGGSLTLIYRADAQPTLVDSLSAQFGRLRVLPVVPKPGAAAIRVIVGAIKGSREPAQVLPGLHLNDVNNRPSEEAENVLRRATALDLARYESAGG